MDVAFEFDSSTQAIAAWCGLALATLLILLRQPATLTLSTGPKGSLRISRHALNRLVEACCEQVRGVVTARASVRRCRGKFRTDIRLKIRPSAKVDAIQGYLTQEITAIYRDHLGLKEIGMIEINVVSVTPEERSRL